MVVAAAAVVMVKKSRQRGGGDGGGGGGGGGVGAASWHLVPLGPPVPHPHVLEVVRRRAAHHRLPMGIRNYIRRCDCFFFFQGRLMKGSIL